MELLAISVDNRLDAASIVDRNKLNFPVLYDTTTVVTRSWGVFDLLRDNVAAPATFVFAPEGHLVAAHIGQHAGDRPDANDILLVVREHMSGPPPALTQAAPTPVIPPTATSAPDPTATTASGPAETPASAEDETPAAGSDIEFDSSGDLAPDFTLPNAQGGEVTLSGYRGDKNVVLVFYRAFW